VALINLLLLRDRERAAAAAATSTSPSAPAPLKIMVCTPSNAAIDELVLRLTSPGAMLDRNGAKMDVPLVRVGAGGGGENNPKGGKSGASMRSPHSLEAILEARFGSASNAAAAGGAGAGADPTNPESVAVAQVNSNDAKLKALNAEIGAVHNELNAVRALVFDNLEDGEVVDDKTDGDVQMRSVSPTTTEQQQSNITALEMRLRSLHDRKRVVVQKLAVAKRELRSARQNRTVHDNARKRTIVEGANIVCCTLSVRCICCLFLWLVEC
jgi:hypothetical protein